MKTDGELQTRMRKFTWISAPSTLIFIGIISIVTPFLNPVYFEHWFAFPAIFYTAAVPLLVLYATWKLYDGLKKKGNFAPFLSSLAIFVLCFTGVGISFYPHIVPPSLTITEAAAPDSSLLFTLYGTAILIPLILSYTAYAYWVFRGKVDPKEGYH